MKSWLFAATFSVGTLAVAPALAADASPHVRAQAQAILAQVQAHPTAHIDVTRSVASLPPLMEPELRAYLTEGTIRAATGPTARADVAYRVAVAKRLGDSANGRQAMTAIVVQGRERRAPVLRAIANSVLTHASAAERATLFAAIDGAMSADQAPLLAGIAGSRVQDTRTYLMNRLASASAASELEATLTALGEFGARPYWEGTSGETERNIVANGVFAQLSHAATSEPTKAAFIKTMLRIDAPASADLLARAQSLTGPEKILADEWAALAKRVHRT